MSSEDDRARRIDETLTRLTAAHAGLPTRPEDEEPLVGPRFSWRSLPRPTLTQLLVLALAVVIFVASSTGWITRGRIAASLRHVAALDQSSGAIVDPAGQKGDQNVLVVTTDPTAAQPAAAGNAAVTPSQANTVSVVHLPAGGGPLVVLSIPAGLETNRPPCPRFDPLSGTYLADPTPAEPRSQLMSALDAGGPLCVTRVVQQLTGLSITGYIGVNLERLPPMVDAVGGIPLCLSRPVQDAVLGPVAPAAGKQQLDGRHTADFVRAGAVAGDPSPDYGRVERQQQVLSAVFDAALSTSGLLDLAQVGAVRAAIGNGIVTDGATIDTVEAVARSLHKLDADGVTFLAAPTAPELNGRGNAVLRDADATALFTAMRRHTALPQPSAGAVATTAAAAGPASMTVEVLNASDQPGRAGKVGDTLKALGYGVGNVSNAPQATSQTVIRFSPDQATAAALLATSLPAATSVPDPGSTGVLQLVLGRSFDDVIKPPAQPKALAAATGDAPAHVAACN